MYYSIRHVTRFRYTTPVRENFTEVRKQPRSEGPQRCVNFSLHTSPNARVMAYRDDFGNYIHHFDVPSRHSHLTITAQALVDMQPHPALPNALDLGAWDQLDAMTTNDAYFDYLMPSQAVVPSTELDGLARTLGLERGADPLTMLRRLNTRMFDHFDYAPESTTINTPIAEVIEAGRGVCQDFAHVMLGLVRSVGVPARYVSGYLFNRSGSRERSTPEASHAWVEALLPGLGWIGFDPTNDLIAAERHIRTAVGRDYHDVPPTRGVYRGGAETELSVSVQVAPSDAPPPEEEPRIIGWVAAPAGMLDQDQQQQ